MFDQLTTAELSALADKLHNGTIRLLDTASHLHVQMSQTATWTPVYGDMKARAAGLLAAGSEQSKIFSEVSSSLRVRLAA